LKPVPRLEGALRHTLEEVGAALVAFPGAAAQATASPWALAERLFGERVLLVERQPIRAIAGGRTFASSNGFTPMHTDSQMHFGVPASVQLLACARPSATGGESTLVDAWELLAAIAHDDPELHARLFDEERGLRFYFGELTGRTVSHRRGHLFFTHPPVSQSGDTLARRLQAHVDRAPRATLRVEADEVLLVNNHRVLHGRLPFADTTREMVRLLVWLAVPWAAPQALVRRARHEEGPADPAASRRLALVLELLRGGAPGAIAARERIPEEDLYRWREDALRAAALALGDE
jgi:alpha-ketoglutarate-dependent taurine dioxygenase